MGRQVDGRVLFGGSVSGQRKGLAGWWPSGWPGVCFWAVGRFWGVKLGAAIAIGAGGH